MRNSSCKEGTGEDMQKQFCVAFQAAVFVCFSNRFRAILPSALSQALGTATTKSFVPNRYILFLFENRRTHLNNLYLLSLYVSLYGHCHRWIFFSMNYLYPKQSSRYCRNGGSTIVPIALPEMHKPFAIPRSFSKYCVTM